MIGSCDCDCGRPTSFTYERPNAYTAKVTAPSSWRILSIKPYCGSLSSLVVEFQNDYDGRVKTLYGTVVSIQEQLENRW